MNQAHHRTDDADGRRVAAHAFEDFGRFDVAGFLGVEIDPERNKVRSKEAIISTDNSKVKVVVIPTDEELMIATDTTEILNNK